MSAAVALVLLLTMAMVAGCVSHSPDHHSKSLSKEKYVALEYRFNETHVTIAGRCHPIMAMCAGSHLLRYTLDENRKNLNISEFPNTENPVNDSLVVFIGQDYSSNHNPCLQYAGGGIFLYSLPAYLPGKNGLLENLTVESVTENGTVVLRYDDWPIVLNPGEQWGNVTREIKVMEQADPITKNNKQNINRGVDINGSIFIEEAPWPGCTNEITTDETLYNAGVFDKHAIEIQKLRVLPVPEHSPEPGFRISANQFMNLTASRGEP